MVYGKYTLLDEKNPNIFSYIRELDGKKILVMLNFTKNTAKVDTSISLAKAKLLLGNYTKTMKYNADGSLDMYLQAEKPEGNKANNWIPVLKGDDFNLFFRAYLPEQSWINQTYNCPGVEKL